MNMSLIKAVAVLMAICCASLHFRAQAGEGARGTSKSWRSLLIYSDDHGTTWETGGYTCLPDEQVLEGRPPHWEGPYAEGSECLVTETVTGDLYMTIRVSYDNCKTWNAGKVLEPERAAYSDLCVLPDMSVGCLYECGKGERSVYDTITFARFNLEWLTDGADSIQTKTK